MTIDDTFARVMIRFQEKTAHHGYISAFLQSRYGPQDRAPGQFSIGSVKFDARQGFETEGTMRHETKTGNGITLFESRTLRSKLIGCNSPTAR